MPFSVPATSAEHQWETSRECRSIEEAQGKAMLAVNHELVTLYWQIGRDILGRQEEAGWGTAVIDRLAKDLHNEFPDVKGFSPRNLGYMKAFAMAWPDEAICKRRLQKSRGITRASAEKWLPEIR
jgi:predicted nuclease of restriction endonuclease-like (RecB) superfamily